MIIAGAADRRTLMLGGVAALLAAIAAWPWLAAPTVPPSPRPATAPAGAPAGVRPLPPLASFAVIAERPLFAPSRRPGASAAQAAAGAAGLRYRLIGIVTAGRDRHALLAAPAAPHPVAVRIGSLLDGWTVTRIEQDRLILSGPAGTVALTLTPAAGKR